jgi:hypothetical protein
MGQKQLDVAGTVVFCKNRGINARLLLLLCAVKAVLSWQSLQIPIAKRSTYVLVSIKVGGIEGVEEGIVEGRLLGDLERSFEGVTVG